MGLLNDLEMQLERQIPAQLQTTLQQALDDYRPVCPECRLAMPSHHRMPETSLPDTARSDCKSPVFRYSECRHMAEGMTPLGDDTR